MRQRITYLLPQGTSVDPSTIKLTDDGLDFDDLEAAAEERRITIGLTQLPEEIQTFLADFHELHIRIASVLNHPTFSPAVSRLPPGLHAFFTPRTPNADTGLCDGLRNILGERVKCSNSSESFSKPPILSERFAASSTYQFYNSPLDLAVVSQVLREGICGKFEEGSSLHTLCGVLAEAESAVNVDYDFDVISHAVTITILWPPVTREGTIRPRVAAKKLEAEDRLEVGILSPEKADEPEELSMGGYLTVIGEDERPNPTIFSFPSRHHPLPQHDKTTYTATFAPPTGLHPKLTLSLPASTLQPPKEDSCALHAYWTLPTALFIDRYQLSDPLFLASQNLIALRSLSGAQDLEAPDWAVKHPWGSAALFELATPNVTTTAEDGFWNITIPTHLRYVNSTLSIDGKTPLAIPWPTVFWACEAQEGLKMSTNPFDRVNLGYDGLFGPKTMFYHVPPNGEVEKLVELLWVPTLDVKNSGWVSFGTVLAVLLGFGWVCWRLVRGVGGSEKKEGEGKKEQCF
ncbi:hypothetical protein M409DRAFT_63892 [Zasmidium cellare ATCC 36951]|uniref:Protein PBN1 n=1 Tax=Zasmidium cellare ATCC 36951 TaxID=1080233 RepID=A0A6A6CUA0_ZASCE|nr:uncharacterized protein M409DRAFT_63892 [Zasmidium cellare ATCC 36951]KAF2170847.1 hypothetical protein M409DRAFT_63892 [Zasmidium cellare ATCC 36951]